MSEDIEDEEGHTCMNCRHKTVRITDDPCVRCIGIIPASWEPIV